MPYQVDVVGQLHLLGQVGVPDGLPEEVVGLAELDGDHDATVHGLVEIVGPVGGQDDQTIVPGEGTRVQRFVLCQVRMQGTREKLPE